MGFSCVERILVIKLRHIGDVLLTVPVFRALKQAFPSAHVSALVNSGTDAVLSGNPAIDEVIVFDRSIKNAGPLSRFVGEAAFLKDLRKRGFDMTVDLTGGDRAAIISFVSGARYRLGVRSQEGFIGKRYFYTHPSSPDKRRHTVLQNVGVLEQSGICAGALSVDFHIPEEDRAFIRRIFAEHNIGGHETLVHVHPTSRWLFKCWKDEHMAEVITRLVQQGTRVVVTSSPEKKEVAKTDRILSLVASRITHQASRVIDLGGRTTIKQLAAVSEAADLFFGVDSAPMHIAAALGTPVIALFGPSGSFHWGPWDNENSSEFKKPYKQRNGVQASGIHTVIQRDWDCIPCGRDGCNGSKISRCLQDIEPDEVMAVLERRLKDGQSGKK